MYTLWRSEIVTFRRQVGGVVVHFFFLGRRIEDDFFLGGGFDFILILDDLEIYFHESHSGSEVFYIQILIAKYRVEGSHELAASSEPFPIKLKDPRSAIRRGSIILLILTRSPVGTLLVILLY